VSIWPYDAAPQCLRGARWTECGPASTAAVANQQLSVFITDETGSEVKLRDIPPGVGSDRLQVASGLELRIRNAAGELAGRALCRRQAM